MVLANATSGCFTPAAASSLSLTKELRRRLAAHQRRVLERAGQIEVVGRAFVHRDAHARAVDVRDGLQRRSFGTM